MAQITVTPARVYPCISELEALAQELAQLADRLDRIHSNLWFEFAGRKAIEIRLSKLSERLRTEQNQTTAMKAGMEDILALYIAAESAILGLLSQGGTARRSGEDQRGYHVDSIVFDDDGSYGGDQGHMNNVYFWDPIRCWDLLRDLRQYFPGMTIIGAFRYFSRLNSVGCGYVALANTLFMEFANRPEEFERIFGYPMYKDGDLNYDRLILDIFATTDKAGFNDRADGMPDGTRDATRARIMEHFLQDKGVRVSTEANANVTASNFREITENGGYVILGYRNGNLYDENGNAHAINGGHAITVTGIAEDGRYIVSSWGKRYYINPADVGDDDTFMVFYYN